MPLARSLDAFLGPDIPLQRTVEHCVIRGKDAVAFARPPPGQTLGEDAELVFDLQVRV